MDACYFTIKYRCVAIKLVDKLPFINIGFLRYPFSCTMNRDNFGQRIFKM